MALVTFTDLCIDTTDPHATAQRWGPLLGLDVTLFHDDGDARLTGPTPGHTIWLNRVPEARTVKQRVHLDLVADLSIFDPWQRLTEPGQFPWTVLVDDEIGEFCVFEPVGQAPAQRLKDVVIDSSDPSSIAHWWHHVLGGTLGHDEAQPYFFLDDVPGWPLESFDFVPVPEPKRVKNRIHWDVELVPGVSVDDLVAVGAVVLRAPDDEVRWTVMADPEGNEFCVFDDH